MDGYEVCRRIRANSATKLLPVVIVTGAGAQERVKGIEAEADDFFVKPGDRHELLARVRSLLKKKELHEETQALGTQLAKWNQELKTKLAHETQLAEVGRLTRRYRARHQKYVDAHFERGLVVAGRAE